MSGNAPRTVPYRFPSDAWIKALMLELNRSPAYAEAAKDWEGDFYFVIEPEGPLAQRATLYMDLWHGKCRDAYLVERPDERQPPRYAMAAPYPVWKAVLERQLDPIQGVLLHRITLRGSLVRLLGAVKAAQELVACCTRVPTEFPG